MKMTFILALAAVHAFACQMVDGPRILGGDLAAASSTFIALDPDLMIAAAPLPGVQRVFHADELVRLARQNSIVAPVPVAEVCFERAHESLTAETLLPVLRAALGIEDAEISILDFSRYGVPRGTLEFDVAGLSPTGLWRGHVAYDDNRSIPVWAKVRVTREQTWVEAIQPLLSSQLVDASQLILRNGPRFPVGPAPLNSIDAAVGRLPIRAIKPGEPIFASMLVTPRQVERGDNVSVEVVSGEARLSFDAAAESAGRMDEMVMIRNPDSGKHFQARVVGKDKVVVQK